MVWRKRHTLRSVATKQVPRNLPICSRKDATSGAAAGVSATTPLGLEQASLILQDQSDSCTGHTGEVHGDVRSVMFCAGLSLLMTRTVTGPAFVVLTMIARCPNCQETLRKKKALLLASPRNYIEHLGPYSKIAGRGRAHLPGVLLLRG